MRGARQADVGHGHVTDVLVGRATEKVVASGHAELSTFGLLKEESPAAIRGYIEQLVGDGLLLREGDPYPVLRLTAAGAALLRGDGDCVLYREVTPPASTPAERGRRSATALRRPGAPSCSTRCATCDCGSRASAACRRT